MNGMEIGLVDLSSGRKWDHLAANRSDAELVAWWDGIEDANLDAAVACRVTNIMEARESTRKALAIMRRDRRKGRPHQSGASIEDMEALASKLAAFDLRPPGKTAARLWKLRYIRDADALSGYSRKTRAKKH